MEQSSLNRKDRNRTSILISNHNDTVRSSKSFSHSLASKDSVRENRGLATERTAAFQTNVNQAAPVPRYKHIWKLVIMIGDIKL